MATIAQLDQLYRQYHNRPINGGDIQALGGEGAIGNIDANTFAQNTIFPSQEFKQRQAQTQVAPISPEDQAGFTQSAQAAYAPVQDALTKKYGALRDQSALQQKLSNSSLLENQNNLDLLQSGSTSNGLQMSDITRSINDANLALQEAQGQTDIGNQVISRANTLQGQEFQRRSGNQQGALQNATLNNQVGLQNNQNQFNQAQQLYSNAYAIPAGQSYNFGPFGNIQGRGIDAGGLSGILPLINSSLYQNNKGYQDIVHTILGRYGYTVGE